MCFIISYLYNCFDFFFKKYGTGKVFGTTYNIYSSNRFLVGICCVQGTVLGACDQTDQNKIPIFIKFTFWCSLVKTYVSSSFSLSLSFISVSLERIRTLPHPYGIEHIMKSRKYLTFCLPRVFVLIEKLQKVMTEVRNRSYWPCIVSYMLGKSAFVTANVLRHVTRLNFWLVIVTGCSNSN